MLLAGSGRRGARAARGFSVLTNRDRTQVSRQNRQRLWVYLQPANRCPGRRPAHTRYRAAPDRAPRASRSFCRRRWVRAGRERNPIERSGQRRTGPLDYEIVSTTPRPPEAPDQAWRRIVSRRRNITVTETGLRSSGGAGSLPRYPDFTVYFACVLKTLAPGSAGRVAKFRISDRA